MTMVRAPILHLPRFDHRVAAEPGPPRRPTGRLWRAPMLDSWRHFTPGRQKSLGAPQRAPSAAAAEAGPEIDPSRRKGSEKSGRNPSLPTGLAGHACSAWRQLEAVTSAHEGRTGRIEARCRREATGEALPTLPEGGRRCWSLPLPKERRICSAAVRIPGPDDSGRSGADTQRIDLGGSRALRHPSVTLRRRRDESQRLATAWCRGDLASWHPRKGAETANGAGIGREASTGAAARPCGARCRSFDRGRCRLQSP
jgi:hypothetical protein